MIVGVLRKNIVVMTGGNLKKSIIVMMTGGNLKKNTIVMMTGGNLKKNTIVMMTGNLRKISVIVNVSLFVVIVKGNIGKFFSANLKAKNMSLELINARL
ncbi:hypothetical protein [Bacillus luti]|uniref:hypothetical protein n=1 Tax=Bacillus luti TaxID=2026191 RepID=UPI0039EF26F3